MAKSVGEVMTPSVRPVNPSQSLAAEVMKAEDEMARHRMRRLPVVAKGRLVGMAAQADVALEAKEKKIGETVEQISQPSSRERE
jgi:CBS domain-containing protein